MRTEAEHTILLKDYTPSPYLIDKVELDVKIGPVTSRVRAFLTVTPREGTAPGTPLLLDGDELKLDAIAIDGSPLPMQRAKRA
jgi:aminopeptidase N